MPRLTNCDISTEEKLVETLTEIKNTLWPNKDTWEIVKNGDDPPCLTPKSNLKGTIWLHAETTVPPGRIRPGTVSENPNAVKRIRVSVDIEPGILKYWPEVLAKQRYVYVNAEGIYDRVGIVDFILTISQQISGITAQVKHDEELAIAENRFIRKLADRKANKGNRNKQSALFKKALEAFGDKVESKYEPYYFNLKIKDLGVMKISVSDEKYSITEIVPEKEWDGGNLKGVIGFLKQLEGIL